jgi:hypothetical protein
MTMLRWAFLTWTLGSVTVFACGPGGVGGSPGTGGSTGSRCVNAGDSCTPGRPITPCVVGVDCCRNECTCDANGKVRCSLACDANLGSGGACGKPDAGGAGAGSLCESDSECAPGLKCCYPCGIPDCQNQCMAPMRNGMCPLFP